MQRALITYLVLVGLAAAPPAQGGSSTTDARVLFNYNNAGTRFSYDILISRDTILEIDNAIFGGSYLGELDASRVNPAAELKERSEQRGEEILDIAHSMAASIPKPEIQPRTPLQTRAFQGQGEAGSNPEGETLFSLTADLSVIEEQLALAESAFTEERWEAGLIAAGQMNSFIQALPENTMAGLEAMVILNRWTALIDANFTDGLLLTPASNGQPPVTFGYQNDALTGRLLRYFVNLSIARGMVGSGGFMAYLVLADEFQAEMTTELSKTLRAYLDEPTADAAATLDNHAKAAIEKTERWRRFFEALSPMEAPLQEKVLNGLAAEMLDKRNYFQPDYKDRLIVVLAHWLK